jgi:hypothetical protein
MFFDRFSFKAVGLSFAFYLVTSVALFAAIFLWWAPAGKSSDELRALAEVDPFILLVQTVLGTVLGVIAGYLAARLSGAVGARNSLILGGLFVLYGVLGIYLHPEHPTAMQIGKLLSPIPLTLVGGFVAVALHRPKTSRGNP